MGWELLSLDKRENALPIISVHKFLQNQPNICLVFYIKWWFPSLISTKIWSLPRFVQRLFFCGQSSVHRYGSTVSSVQFQIWKFWSCSTSWVNSTEELGKTNSISIKKPSYLLGSGSSWAVVVLIISNGLSWSSSQQSAHSQQRGSDRDVGVHLLIELSLFISWFDQQQSKPKWGIWEVQKPLNAQSAHTKSRYTRHQAGLGVKP